MFNNNENNKVKLMLKYREKSLKLAKGILKRWGSYLDEDEIESISDLSLCEAANRFDVEKKVSFITFLYYYIKGNLVKSIAEATIINGCDMKTYTATHGEKNNMSSQLELQNLINEDIVNATIGSTASTPIDTLLNEELHILGKKACDELDDFEKTILEKIYLKGEQVLSIAKELGYSRCHITRIKKRSLGILENFISKRLNYEADDKILSQAS